MTDRKKISVALAELSMATAGKELDAPVLVVYLKNLAEYPDERLLAAIGRLTKTARFFPSVGDICAAMQEAPAVRAAEAWTRAVEIASKGGGVDRSGMATPEIARAVRLIGGWDTIGHTPYEKLVFVEKRFLEVFAGVEAADENLPALGFSDLARLG